MFEQQHSIISRNGIYAISPMQIQEPSELSSRWLRVLHGLSPVPLLPPYFIHMASEEGFCGHWIEEYGPGLLKEYAGICSTSLFGGGPQRLMKGGSSHWAEFWTVHLVV